VRVTMERRHGKAGFVAVALGCFVACGSSGGTGAGGAGGGTGARGGTPGNGGSGGTSGGAGTAGTAGGGGGADAGVCDHQLASAACWASMGLTGLTSNMQQIIGGAFDGRYLYLVNSVRGAPSLRHDTQAASLSGGWSAFTTSTLKSGPSSFQGAAFDGRYVYFVPWGDLAVRYDSQASFNTGASWTSFNTGTLVPQPDGGIASNATSYFGAAFDGRYLYYVPARTLTGPANSIVLRFDTQAGFTTASSWSTFDASTIGSSVRDFAGAAFDGRYVYFVPRSNGQVLRCDTQATFTTAATWATFDTTTLPTPASSFEGAAFDGRYVYLAPNSTGILTRYDSQGTFASAASWETLDATMLGSSSFSRWYYSGATFDGRYVYFVPNSGSLLRYDSQAPFGATTSWGVLDLQTVGLVDGAYRGAVFDGRYVYILPGGLIPLVRFDAQASPSLPPNSGASFF